MQGEPTSEDKLEALVEQLDQEQIERDAEMLVRWRPLIEEARRTRSLLRRFDPNHPLPRIGRFEVLRYRARGGFGVIFEGRDPELGRPVAIKLCLADSEADRQALLREAQLMSQLCHPNVVTVLEVGRFEGEVFLVMEYLDGGTAKQLIGRSWEEIVQVYRGAAAGLAAVHDAGIVHGDFKPGNILLDAKGWPRVADFGLAHRSQSPIAQGGTAIYSAREVLLGGEPDARSDQWSFCAALWHTLHGLPPFMAEDADELLAEMDKGAQVHGLAQGPEALGRIARRGLSRDPGERFPDMHALAAELDALRLDGAVSLRVAGPAASPVKRWRGRTLMLGCSMVGMLGTLALLLWRPPTLTDSSTPDESSSDSELTTAKLTQCETSLPVSAELETVCQSIRQGELSKAEKTWLQVREVRSPESGDPQRRSKLNYIATETQIAIDTADSLAASTKDPGTKEKAEAFSSYLQTLYDGDMDELDPPMSSGESIEH